MLFVSTLARLRRDIANRMVLEMRPTARSVGPIVDDRSKTTVLPRAEIVAIEHRRQTGSLNSLDSDLFSKEVLSIGVEVRRANLKVYYSLLQ